MASERRENAITRGGTEKYYFVICFSVDTSTPELASMESTCFASVTGVAFAPSTEKEKEKARGRQRNRENGGAHNPYSASVQLGGNRARQASSRGLSACRVHGYISRLAMCLFVAFSRSRRDDDAPINVTEDYLRVVLQSEASETEKGTV